MFGEDYEFKLGCSDQALTKVAKKHLKANELTDEEIQALEDNINNDAKNLNNHLRKIPDLYLYRKYPDSKSKQVKNLVIELKAPKVSLGKKEREQADKIFQGIATASGSGYTVSDENQWEYYLISSEIKPELESLFANREEGILNQYPNYTIYAETWESIIRSARFKLEKTKKQLEIDIKEEHKENLLKQYLGDVGFED